MAAISNWMHVDIFTVDQASALWCGFDPGKISTLDSQNPSEITAIKQMLIGGIVSKELTADSARNPLHMIGNYSESLVSREGLEKFARMKKLFPAFLFNTLVS